MYLMKKQRSENEPTEEMGQTKHEEDSTEINLNLKSIISIDIKQKERVKIC